MKIYADSVTNVSWKYKNKVYKTRREITEKYNLSTCKWNAKLRDGEIIKLIH